MLQQSANAQSFDVVVGAHLAGAAPVRPLARAGTQDRQRWWMLAGVSLALLLSMTTWFSATAVIPQLKAQWGLSDTLSAWMTIAVQVGFVIGAVGMSTRASPTSSPLAG